ncbi:hypothetical protein SAMN04515620_13510 [Collimonas sp. OK607]|uniref:hypothetical protein n=1 Tax=Collimonas sp. OK607 TaxID=1798194 RepID=UPI0008EBA020|nr:hypothetical protein [Collimonas sp. OK607]SFB28339.1 hypothetical protein SAMN04515620_13510 [Collimonas sp. OK607]
MTDHSAAAPDEYVDDAADAGNAQKIHEPRLWRDDGWTARIIKNDDDDGWAVAMIKDGEPEPALIGPWTMGRDKKNPKPLDPSAFITLVKTASEFVRRHEQQLHAMLHKSIVASDADSDAVITVTLDIIPDDDFPYALLTAHDEDGEQLAQARVAATFKLSESSARAWIANEFRTPH